MCTLGSHECILQEGKCGGGEDCEDWESCESNQCILKEGMCEADQDCGEGSACNVLHECIEIGTPQEESPPENQSGVEEDVPPQEGIFEPNESGIPDAITNAQPSEEEAPIHPAPITPPSFDMGNPILLLAGGIVILALAGGIIYFIQKPIKPEE